MRNLKLRVSYLQKYLLIRLNNFTEQKSIIIYRHGAKGKIILWKGTEKFDRVHKHIAKEPENTCFWKFLRETVKNANPREWIDALTALQAPV